MNMPNIFIAGTKIKSGEVNENFQTCKNAIDLNGVEINETKESISEVNKRFDNIEPQIMPDYGNIYNDKSFIVSDEINKIMIKKGTKIRLVISDDDTRYLQITEDTEYNIFEIMDTGISSLTPGVDYYIYVVQKDDIDSETEEIIKTIELKASLNSTYPQEYNANNTRKIGGFHTLCVGVTSANAPAQLDGTQHPAIGYNAGDIIPNSVWCLSHRPQSEPNGMVYVDLLDKWVDIYLQSGKDGALTSVFGAVVADSRQQQNHQWDMQLTKKMLATDNDFNMFVEGSNQKTAIYGSASPNPKTAGGHVDTAGKRMISKFFVEECCGFLYQWLDELGGNGGTTWNNYDGDNTRGNTYGVIYALHAGGYWLAGVSCGSRCRNANNSRSYVSTTLGGRGVSLSLSCTHK